MKYNEYLVRYETVNGEYAMRVEACDIVSASDVCYYVHGDELGYKEIVVIEL